MSDSNWNRVIAVNDVPTRNIVGAARHPDGKRHTLRLLAGTLSGMIGRLHGNLGQDAIDDVDEAWRAVLARLDLGSNPEVVTCPGCGAAVIARRCAYCSQSLETASESADRDEDSDADAGLGRD